ncbi:Smr/MutS family protein [Devosia sp. J2-20]|jgi:DNA-nicking Smr family endonuclease|uniref:Smr/MutS family protein n=1 Tax=Devosia TaxID=46913 RepID=UPI0022AF6656|nr:MULTISPECIES: Smr/MutS family protein [Devosia]MCZ4347413.1 Smr/MutS family protein [Devosia neptuniae]WDR00121.1 Smr/MutS family protein [Devosia sp. J2-20]|tara:strand:- start:7218 stop:7811 length:594 start_codon:yes stop_codon:yes gene_type:complete
MSKRDPRRLPHDFHLWTAVAATVDPLRRKGLLKLGTGPLPLPVEEPPRQVPANGKAAPKRQAPRKPFLPPYQAPQANSAPPDKAVDPSIRKKLGRGRIEIDGKIDLHDMTQAEARSALHRFVQAKVAQGARTILVITGKGLKSDDDYIAAMTGRGILRTMLPIWLNEPSLAPLVSGWSAAARGHGGEGAWYVRLRRR